MDTSELISEYVSKIKISLLTFIITFLIFYFLSDRILNFFWNLNETYHLTLLAGSLGVPNILFFTLAIASINFLPAFIFEIISLLDPIFCGIHKKIETLKAIFYAVFLNAVGLAFAYWIVLPILLDKIVKANAKLGLQNFIAVDKFIELIAFSIIIGSIIAQIPFIIWIGISRIGKTRNK